MLITSSCVAMLRYVHDYQLASCYFVIEIFFIIGLKFWKVGSRKIFAVVESELDRNSPV